MTLNPKIIARRAKARQELKQKILDFSYQVVKNNGADALTVRKISEEIEYSLPVIYHLYKDKDEILKDVADLAFVDLIKVAIFEETFMTNAYLEWTEKNNNLFLLINNEKYVRKLVVLEKHEYPTSMNNNTKLFSRLDVFLFYTNGD